MNLEVETFELQGPLLIHGLRHHDTRGYFSEIYHKQSLGDLGLPDFVQDNLSLSRKGVVRGMHWQSAPFAQGKLVTCIAGEILDIFVDVRSESGRFGQAASIMLSSERLTSLWVPPGFAHGFQAMVEDTIVLYKVDKFWSKSHEQSFSPLSHPQVSKLIQTPWHMSDKDLEANSWESVKPDSLIDPGSKKIDSTRPEKAERRETSS